MKRVSLYIDLGFCLVFLPLMIFMFPVERWWGTYPVFFSLFVAWLYATYFIYKYFIVPNLFHGRRLRLYALVAMVFSLGITLLFSSYKITSPFYHQWQHKEMELAIHSWGVRLNQQAIWLHYILVVIFCCAVGMLTEAYRQRLERFINLTKYMYNNANREFIPLAEEVEYISQYIDLQQLRLNELADVRFNYDAEDESMLVPPMLLITFVENAFKYGISSNEPCYVHIHLVQCDERLTFEIENRVFEHAKPDSKRMGIENCRRRLSLLYPDRYRLDVGPGEGQTFRVKLELQSNCLLLDFHNRLCALCVGGI